MSTQRTDAGPVPPVLTVGVPRLTAGLDEYGRLDLDAHRRVHGNLPALTAAELVALAEAIDLRGRGGASFPFARKARAVLDSCHRRSAPPVIVVNATEGEPASWKDKALLTRTPHLILDGAAVAAVALRAKEIVVGVADDGIGARSIAAALAERRMPVPARVVAVPHRFISGESGALVRGINGEAHLPPGRKVRASDRGVLGLPTLLSNAETCAQLAIAVRLGPWEYAAAGLPGEPGTVLLTVGGSAVTPAVVECPCGTPLADVLAMCGADTGPGILAGGYHGTWIGRGAAATANLSRRGIAEAGGTFGAGMILPIGPATCPLGEVARVVQYLAGESAGQCGPCRLGLPALARSVTLVTTGGGAIDTVRAAAAAVRGRGACGHPDGTARFALSALEVFHRDVEAHAGGEGCGKPVRGILPLPYGADRGARTLVVDWTRCDGHGLCAAVAPEIIRLDPNGFPAFPQTPLPPSLENGARKAVNVCPALALRLTQPA